MIERIRASVIDADFEKNPAARLVKGFWGQPWIDQFSGAGPSPAEFAFKIILVNGRAFMPDPATRGLEAAKTRSWIPCPIQPPAEAIFSL